MASKKIKTALISVFHKDGIDSLAKLLNSLGVEIISTGGTYRFISDLGVPVRAVEDLTSYPSILGGRVKTLHPKVFGGILARRDEEHLAELVKYDLPEIDMVVVDLYPFEKTVQSGASDAEIIEKIDIGGISLIRAAAKNFNDLLVISSRNQYGDAEEILRNNNGSTDLATRKKYAFDAFKESSMYDMHISDFFKSEAEGEGSNSFEIFEGPARILRYGENPHQEGIFYGKLEKLMNQISGKPLSYNNLIDIDAALHLMNEFSDEDGVTFAVLKHTNPCGLAKRSSSFEAWIAALAGDPISAFGGVLICNGTIDFKTAEKINEIFYEVLLAKDFDEDALELLRKKKKRIIIQLVQFPKSSKQFKSILDGVIKQDQDLYSENKRDLVPVTELAPGASHIEDLLFANKCVKHLKSNAISIVKNKQLIGIGCGQTSRVDALKQAILKAKHFDFDLQNAVMASDAFFPFPDCVEIADSEGITSVIQPGGSVKDQESIDYCNQAEMSMVFTGKRHFKH